MPRKSIETPKTTERKPRSVVRDYPIIERVCYKDLQDFKNKLHKLKTIKDWEISTSEDEVILSKKSKNYNLALPYITIIIDNGLGFTIQIFNWSIPEDHIIYKCYKRSMRNITISNLINVCMEKAMCSGIKSDIRSNSVISQAIPKSRETLDIGEEESLKALSPYESVTFFRVNSCEILIEGHYQQEVQCPSCIDHDIITNSQKRVNVKKLNQPAKLKAPVSVTNPQRIKLTLQQHRLKCSQLENELRKMKEMLKSSNVHVNKSLNIDFINIFNNNN